MEEKFPRRTGFAVALVRASRAAAARPVEKIGGEQLNNANAFWSRRFTFTPIHEYTYECIIRVPTMYACRVYVRARWFGLTR